MPDEAVNFDRVTKVYREESQKKGLTPVEPDFWDKVARYVAHLEKDLADARARDPNAKAAMLLQDELRKVLAKREQIYQFRERKLSLLASQVASGTAAEAKGLARQEQELLHRLVEILSGTRSTTLASAPPAPGMAATPPPAPSAVAAPPANAAPPPPEGVIVHVLEDVPPFAGPDGTYRLKKEDVVTVHPTIAKVLTERGKARVVNPAP